jgi:peptidoglycan hydrolase-like amidase
MMVKTSMFVALFVAIALVGFVSIPTVSAAQTVTKDHKYQMNEGYGTQTEDRGISQMNGEDVSHGWGITQYGSWSAPEGYAARPGQTGYGSQTEDRGVSRVNGDDVSHGWGITQYGSWSAPEGYAARPDGQSTAYGNQNEDEGISRVNGDDVSHGWGITQYGAWSTPEGY